MEINICKLAKNVKLKSPDLVTRPTGKIMYEKLLKKINIVQNNEVVVLDFENIKVIDSSFVDEFLVKLIYLSKDLKKVFYVKLRNISNIAENNIDLVFKSYSNYDDKKIVVITEDISQNNSFFIGNLEKEEKEIIEYLRINKSLTKKEFGNFLDMSENNIDNILNKLYFLRVIRKEENDLFRTV